ncbi:MAG TPA: transposase [Candidatus Nitrosocosmicus sp.]
MFRNNVAVNVKTKKILAILVTDELVHNNETLPELINGMIKTYEKMTIDKLIAEDDAYDDNDIFRFLTDYGILSCVKLRKNCRVGCRKDNIL